MDSLISGQNGWALKETAKLVVDGFCLVGNGTTEFTYEGAAILLEQGDRVLDEWSDTLVPGDFLPSQFQRDIKGIPFRQQAAFFQI